jgi:hypothetical protein
VYAGQIVINEVMADPSAVADADAASSDTSCNSV